MVACCVKGDNLTCIIHDDNNACISAVEPHALHHSGLQENENVHCHTRYDVTRYCQGNDVMVVLSMFVSCSLWLSDM